MLLLLKRCRSYQVFEPLEKLTENMTRLLLRKLLFADNEVEKFALGSKLQHKIHSVSFIKSIFQTQQIWMVHSHQQADFLLQRVRLRLLGVTRAFLEHFHCILSPGGPLNTEVDSCKMTFAQLSKDAVLLSKAIGVSGLGLPKDKPRLVQDCDLVAILELTVFIPSNNCIIDKRPVAG